MSTKKSIGQILVEKAKELDSTYQPDNKDDMAEAVTIILNNMATGETVDPEALNEILEKISAAAMPCYFCAKANEDDGWTVKEEELDPGQEVSVSKGFYVSGLVINNNSFVWFTPVCGSVYTGTFVDYTGGTSYYKAEIELIPADSVAEENDNEEPNNGYLISMTISETEGGGGASYNSAENVSF